MIRLTVFVTDTTAPVLQQGRGLLIITIIDINEQPPVCFTFHFFTFFQPSGVRITFSFVTFSLRRVASPARLPGCMRVNLAIKMKSELTACLCSFRIFFFFVEGLAQYHITWQFVVDKDSRFFRFQFPYFPSTLSERKVSEARGGAGLENVSF